MSGEPTLRTLLDRLEDAEERCLALPADQDGAAERADVLRIQRHIAQARATTIADLAVKGDVLWNAVAEMLGHESETGPACGVVCLDADLVLWSIVRDVRGLEADRA